MDWYILKVPSKPRGVDPRRAVAAGGHRRPGTVLRRRYRADGKSHRVQGRKKKVIKRKLYPGYLVVHMEINDDTWFLVRETPGLGIYRRGRAFPVPMLPHEVSRIVAKQEEKSEKAPKLKISFHEGDRVKINEGTFENFEGDVGRHRRAKRPGDRNDQHLRPVHAGRVGVLANRSTCRVRETHQRHLRCVSRTLQRFTIHRWQSN